MTCRICHGTMFVPVLDLGMTPYADDFLTPDRLAQPEVRYPLQVIQCTGCGLVQLSYVAPREALYSPDYPYVSSTTATGVAHYREMAETITRRLDRRAGLAIDIGSNVGVLLDGFKACGLSVLGIEPVPPIAAMANVRGISTINAFFSSSLVEQIVETRGRAAIITGTNVVAHIDDLHDLAAGIHRLLAPRGAFVFEAPYLGELLARVEYDTIYHEHLSYLAVGPIAALCDRFGLEVFDLEFRAIHGGTLRYYIAAKGDYPVADIVGRTRMEERLRITREALDTFAVAAQKQRSDLNLLLRRLKADGHRIAAVGAPAKGMTLLNYCKLDGELLDFVTEKAPLKIGRYTPGTHLPVLGDGALLSAQPDYALLLPWNFADEIMRNLSEYIERGGRFIIPIPTPRIVERIEEAA